VPRNPGLALLRVTTTSLCVSAARPLFQLTTLQMLYAAHWH